MKKVLAYISVFTLFCVTVGISFASGFAVGKASDGQGVFSLPGLNPSPAQSETPDSAKQLFAPFWESWDLVHKQYVDQPVDDTVLMRGAIRGMLESLGDQHTSFMDPQEYEDANASLEGNYEGIGAYVDTTADVLTIISPIPGSPAEKAGLRAKDEIIAIDGEDMTGISPELVRRKVLGPAGSTVKLTIHRGEEEPFDVSLIRAKITIPSVESKMLENDLGYIKINTFGSTTVDELKKAIKEIRQQNPKGLVVDIRNNGGGYLSAAVGVTSQFLKDGVVLHERYGDGKTDTYNVEAGGLATDLPMVLLVNESSASASEILAGAVQDYGRAKLVGVTTYGKGSVQTWNELRNKQGAVRVTIAKWLTPKERIIHKIGLQPDYEVKITDEDIKAQRDPQLEKAIEVLLQLIGK